jgi:hypothetical protein
MAGERLPFLRRSRQPPPLCLRPAFTGRDMTRSATGVAAALAALAACSHSNGPGPVSGRYEDRFDTNSLTSYATYSDQGASWVISGGALFGVGPAIQSVLIRRGLTRPDAWVETVSARADDGGLVLRFQDPLHYYLLAFRDDAAPSPRGRENLAVYHHVGLAYHQLWTGNVKWTRGTAHTIRFQAAGDRLRVYYDGALAVELLPSPAINDPAPYTGSGGMGLRHYGTDATWITSFNTFRWHLGG